MSEGLKAADLFVRVGVSLREFDQGMAKMLGTVKQISSQVAELAGKMASVSMRIAAPFLGAIAVASKMDAQVGASIERIKAILTTFAVEIGRAFLPALKSVGDWLSRLLGLWQSLDSGTKQHIVTIGEYAIGMMAASKVIQIVAQASTALSGSLALVTKAFSGVGQGSSLIGLTKLVSILGLIYMTVGVLKLAWDEWGDSISRVAKTVVDSLGAALKWTVDALAGAFDWVMRMLAKLLRAWASVSKVINKGMNFLTGKDDDPRVIAAQQQSQADYEQTARSWETPSSYIGINLLEGLEAFGEEVVKYSKDIASGADKVADAANTVFKPFFDAIAKVKESLTGVGTTAVVDDDRTDRNKAIDEEYAKHTDTDKPFATSPPLTSRESAEQQRMRERMDESVLMRRDPSAIMARDAGASLGQSVISSQPVLGNIMQGAATAGPWGALAGLLASSSQFGLLMDKLGAMLQRLADVCGRLIEPLFPLVDALMNIVNIVMDGLGPILQQVGLMFVQLAPIFDIIGEALKALFGVLSAIFMPYLRYLFYVFKAVAVAIGGFVFGIGWIWNRILDGLDFIIGWIDERLHDFIQSLKMNETVMSDALKKARDMDMAGAQQLIESSMAASDALDGLAETVNTLNTPQGFKTSDYMFGAANPFELPGGKQIEDDLLRRPPEIIEITLPPIDAIVTAPVDTQTDFQWRNKGDGETTLVERARKRSGKGRG